VLDCFSYTGGFALSALAAGARSVMAVESSSDAVALAKDNLRLNNLPEDRLVWIQDDVFSSLRKLRDRGMVFDLIVRSSKFAPTSVQVERASRAYKDINLLAFKLLRPGGFLVTFSCSGGVSAELFQKIVFAAALDAGVQAQIVERLDQAFDHPVALNFPEGAYLKGLILHVIVLIKFPRLGEMVEMDLNPVENSSALSPSVVGFVVAGIPTDKRVSASTGIKPLSHV
jgi:23S rRNA (cytosine1962-C5)-methyltransferase